MSVLEHLNEALDHLNQAREEAGLGTGMMIQERIESIEQLRDRTEQNDASS